MQKEIVLSVDDDNNLQLVISQYLEGEGYKLLSENDGAGTLSRLDSADPDVILLDLVLPDTEGLSLIPQIKAKSDAAIIVVSGKSDTTEKIICLEMGADDYITKPFEMRELSARIKAVLRRRVAQDTSGPDKEKDNDIIHLGEKWILDRAQYQVFDHKGNSLNFTSGEFELFEALCSHPNRAISREHLFELTRDGDYDVYDRAIDIQIARIRKKLHDEKGEVIKTIRGVGYMFAQPAAKPV